MQDGDIATGVLHRLARFPGPVFRPEPNGNYEPTTVAQQFITRAAGDGQKRSVKVSQRRASSRLNTG